MGQAAIVLVNCRREPVNNEQLVAALLGFANGKDVVMLPEPLRGPALNVYMNKRLATAPQDRLREEIRGHLAQVIEDCTRFSLPAIRRSARAAVAVSQVKAECIITQTTYPNPRDPTNPNASRTGITMEYFRDFKDEVAALRFAVLLLQDTSPREERYHMRKDGSIERIEPVPYGNALCRCQLERCGEFYLAEKDPRGGPANRTYCTPDHRDKGHDAGRAKRRVKHKDGPRLKK